MDTHQTLAWNETENVMRRQKEFRRRKERKAEGKFRAELSGMRLATRLCWCSSLVLPDALLFITVYG